MKHILFSFFLLVSSPVCFAQTFMNGSFETNTAGFDQINISNVAFNGFMANTIAYGSFGDMDIISSATYCGLAQNGLWYVALTGTSTDAFTMQLSAPLVMGNSYTITFWDRGCWGTFSGFAPPVSIGLSTVPGTPGTQVFTAGGPSNGTWVQRTATFIAPNNGQYISVYLNTGGLGDWTQVDNFAFSVTSTAPVANFVASNTNLCPGDCINFTDLSTGTPTSWAWTFTGASTTSSTAQNPTNICYPTPGVYPVSLTATNANGNNTFNQTTYITVNSLPTVTAASSGTITCTNTSVTLTGTSVGSTMVWNGGSLVNAPDPATVSAAGTYTVTATNAAGCVSTATITVTSNTVPPTVTASSSGNLSCTVSSVTLTGVSSGTMVWNGGSLVNAPNPATVSAAGTYTVTATDPTNGCTSTATVTVTSSAVLPTVTAISSGTITCTNTSVTLTGTSTGNTMVWNGGSLVNAANPATVTAAGSYTVTATDPLTGCTNTAIVVVTANTTPPTVTATGGLLTCINSSVTLTGTSTGNMVWNGGSLVNAPNPATVTAAGGYIVTATDPTNGCTSTATVTVTSNTTPPTVTAIASGNITCANPSVTLTGTSVGSTMLWNGGSLVNAPNPATVTTAGTYTVTAVDNTNGCTSTTTVTITSNTTPPNLTVAPGDTLTCAQSSALVTASSTTSGVSYAWTGPGIVSGGNTANCLVNAGGTYTCTVTDPLNGCTTIQTVVVVANINPPTATASGSATINYGNSTPLTATGGSSYVWTPSTGLTGFNCPNCQNPIASPLQTTTYCVTVTDSIGCSDSACVTVFVDIICGEFLFPNAFSPNGDGQNEGFHALINPGCIRDFHLLVYDRWGEIVFESTNYTEVWDGTFKGQLLDNAVFVYYATGTLATTGEKLIRKGNVSLIR